MIGTESDGDTNPAAMRGAPMVMESSFTMARLSGKLDELKDAMHVTCASQQLQRVHAAVAQNRDELLKRCSLATFNPVNPKLKGCGPRFSRCMKGRHTCPCTRILRFKILRPSLTPEMRVRGVELHLIFIQIGVQQLLVAAVDDGGPVGGGKHMGGAVAAEAAQHDGLSAQRDALAFAQLPCGNQAPDLRVLLPCHVATASLARESTGGKSTLGLRVKFRVSARAQGASQTI